MTGEPTWVLPPADRNSAPLRVGAPASLRTEVVASLRRLRVEWIDLYQMHWPAEDGTPLEAYWQVFTDLKHEGKICAAGSTKPARSSTARWHRAC
jgi:aryl-alcohol dehydrogenase-like predicted oxidoreductase